MVVKVADMEIDTDVHKCFDPIEPENESSALAKHYQVMYVQTMAFTEQTHKVRSQESISSGSVASEYVLEDLLDDYTNKSKSSTLWRVARMFVCTKRDIRVRPTQLQNAKFRLAGLVTDVSICEDSVREQFRMHKMGKLDSLALRQSRIQLPNIEEKEVEKEEDLDFLIRRSSSNVKKKNLERRASKKMKNEREAMVEVLMHEQMLVFAENDDNENADDNNKSKIDGRRAQYRIALRGNVHAVARDAVDSGMKDLMGSMLVVSTVFLELDELIPYLSSSNLERVQAVYLCLCRIVKEYGGALRQFVQDDKSCVCIVMFGVPGFAYTDNEGRALRFATFAISALKNEFEMKRCRAGIARGSVYVSIYDVELRERHSLFLFLSFSPCSLSSLSLSLSLIHTHTHSHTTQHNTYSRRSTYSTHHIHPGTPV
jgi:hypothetical protein